MLNDCDVTFIVSGLEEQATKQGWTGGTEPLTARFWIGDWDVEDLEDMLDLIPNNPQWYWEVYKEAAGSYTWLDVSYTDDLSDILADDEFLKAAGYTNPSAVEVITKMEATESNVTQYLEDMLNDGDYPDDYYIDDLWYDLENINFEIVELWGTKYFIHVAY